jgi:molecular chaperone HscA
VTNLIQICEPGQTPLPHAETTAVGIDLGTTHSVVAIATDAQASAIRDAHGRSIIPSVVHYGASYITVGHDARQSFADGEEDVIASIKRWMGTGKIIEANGRRLTPVDISADILKHLRRMAEEALGRGITKAVITVPAYFDDAARNATKHAAHAAGLEVLRLINEPTAAALAYGIETQSQGTYAVYDFGGGTFDISILKLEDGVFQVLSTSGDTTLGGDDIDHAIALYALDKLGIAPESLDTPTWNKLLSVARMKKEKLSLDTDVILKWEGVEVPLDRPLLERLAEPFITRTLQCCESALTAAGLTPHAMSGVVLVGGSTRMALVKQSVAKFFGMTPLDSIDPDLVVAYGAAVQAEALTRGGSDNLLLDVTPLSLGLETYGGIVEKIIYRNSPIPCAVEQEFTTYQDNQGAMKIHVLQGEREKVSDCRSLAQFDLRGIPPMVAGAARIKVTFSIDADGLLTVTAQEMLTGAKQEVVVTDAAALEFEEIERMLRESNEHARADILERLLIEARVAADRAIAEVRSAITAEALLLKPGEQAMIDAQVATLTAAIGGMDRGRIDHEVHALNALVGPFAERRMNAAISGALAGKKVDEVR